MVIGGIPACYNLVPMDDDSNTVRVPRPWIFMVMGASVFGAAMAAIIMVNVLVPRLSQNEPAKAVLPPARNEPPSNLPRSNEPDSSERPPQNAPPVKPPQPPANREQPPREEFPPPVVEPEPAAAQWQAQPDARFRVRPKRGEWTEGAANTRLRWGDHVQVRVGAISLVCAGITLNCASGCELELAPTAGAPQALTLWNGRFAITRELATPAALKTPAAQLTFGQTRFVAVVWPERTELMVNQGEAGASREGEQIKIAAGQMGELGARFTLKELDAEARRALADEFKPPSQRLLFWDFEADAPCRLGKRFAGGAQGSKGALGATLEFAAIGSDEGGQFTPEPNSRLRLWVKTNAPSIRLSFVTATGALNRTWILYRELNGRDWEEIDVALSDFIPQEKDVQGFAGRACGYLQCRMRFPERSEVLPSERMLLVDDVEIYTPK